MFTQNCVGIVVRQLFKIVFGRRVRHLRKEQKWSQEKLAERAGLSRETISRIENGKFGTKFEHVDKIVEAFDMSFSEFFKDLPEKP
jgi:transcriptional regulator with XRE-family HTH domain